MSATGVPEAAQQELLRLIAGVLLLGNVDFEDDERGTDLT
jgi:myosin heavy subunit